MKDKEQNYIRFDDTLRLHMLRCLWKITVVEGFEIHSNYHTPWFYRVMLRLVLGFKFEKGTRQ